MMRPATSRALSVSALLLLLLRVSRCAVPHVESELDLSCSGDFSLFNSFCYRFFISKRPFHTAEKCCGRYQSSLVSIHSPAEQDFVVQLAENNSAFWIGLNDQDGPDSTHTEGVFKWSDGSQFSRGDSFQQWKSGQPDNHRHLDCVKADLNGWSMASGGCATPRLPFLCKRRACPTDMAWNGNSCQTTFQATPTSQFHSSVQPTRTIHPKTVLAAITIATVLLALCFMLCVRRTHSESKPLSSEYGIVGIR